MIWLINPLDNWFVSLKETLEQVKKAIF